MLHEPPGDLTCPDLLVLGNACIDRQIAPDAPATAQPVERLGGASAFASRVASLGGARVGMVAAGPAHFARLHALGKAPGISLAVQPCQASTLFEVYGSGPNQTRRERAVCTAAVLAPHSIPQTWRNAPVTYVAPVLDECPAALVDAVRSPVVVVGAQGWLRQLDAHGWVNFAEATAFLRPPRNVTAMIFSEADHPQAGTAAAALARQGILVVVTQSSAGGIIFAPRQPPQRYVAVDAVERDTTGAGDCFGVVFALALGQKISLQAAASLAARAAAKVVEGPELGTLRLADLEQVRRAA